MGAYQRTFWTTLLCLAFVLTSSAQSREEPFPPNAKPGACYARVFLPAVYRDVDENIVERAAFETFAIVPATYEAVEKRLLVAEAYQRIEVVAASFEWVEEKILLKPASQVAVEAAPQFENVRETVVDEPAHTVWKAGQPVLEDLQNGTGEVMCLVEVPATYKTVTRRVLKKAAETTIVEVPAQYQVVRKRLIKAPARTEVVDVPAKYETISTMRELHPAEIKKVMEPEQMGTIARRRKVAEGRLAWRQVVCETNLTPTTISEIQRALRDAGVDPGSIDGALGPQTIRAMKKFQTDNGLPAGQVTIDLLRSLGVDPTEIAAGELELRNERDQLEPKLAPNLQSAL
jgi:hypothetical protein